MTRGRKPLIALKEAYEIALKRGQVLLVSDGRYDHFHFILFTKDRVTFIKVKRTLANTDDPKEILDTYERDIRHLARVPLNDVDALELWARSPRGDFFFFRIEKDRILRLTSDGSVVTGITYPLEPEKPKAPAITSVDPAPEQDTNDPGPDQIIKDPAPESAKKNPASKQKGKNPNTKKKTKNPSPKPVANDAVPGRRVNDPGNGPVTGAPAQDPEPADGEAVPEPHLTSGIQSAGGE